MRIGLALVLLASTVPSTAAAQASNPAHAAELPPLDLVSIDAEAGTATTLYLGGTFVLILGAGASVGLGLASVETGLSTLFVPGASRAASDGLEDGAIVAACVGGVVGLLLLGFAVRFDLDSGERRERWRVRTSARARGSAGVRWAHGAPPLRHARSRLVPRADRGL